jgi:hypothetical protein
MTYGNARVKAIHGHNWAAGGYDMIGPESRRTRTDYHGYHQLVQIHDPPLIHELEHHHVLHFSYRRKSSGEVESDFDLDNAPALAFAARATSSFPGAFPPARIVEVDDLAIDRNDFWSAPHRLHRAQFPPATNGPRSTPPFAPSSMGRSSITGRSAKPLRRSMAGRPIARSTAAWCTSIPIRRLRSP